VIRIRQKTSEENSLVEKQIKLFENEDTTKKTLTANDYHQSSSSSCFPPVMRSFSTSSAVDISAYNNATIDALDFKTMLLKMKRLLEQVTQMLNTFNEIRSLLIRHLVLPNIFSFIS
jgi:hypothetical protein